MDLKEIAAEKTQLTVLASRVREESVHFSLRRVGIQECLATDQGRCLVPDPLTLQLQSFAICLDINQGNLFRQFFTQ